MDFLFFLENKKLVYERRIFYFQKIKREYEYDFFLNPASKYLKENLCYYDRKICIYNAILHIVEVFKNIILWFI